MKIECDRFVALIAVVIISLSVTAQNAAVYLSAADLKSNRSAVSSNCRLHLVNWTKRVVCRCKDSVTKFTYDSIFGYRENDGTLHRLVGNKVYRVLNPRETVILYEKTDGSGIRNSPVVTSYYFSVGFEGDLNPLTRRAVLSKVDDSSYLSLLLELYCRSDDDLLDYDDFHHMYMINRLLMQASNHSCCFTADEKFKR